MFDLTARRREMMQKKNGSSTVVFDDVIIVKEATTINTKKFSNAFINDYVVNKPKKIILRCYPVIPTAGRTNMRMGDSIWNASGYVDQYIADHRFSGAKTGNLGDGTEMAFESICNFVEGTENDFDCVTEFNTGGTITKRISFSPTNFALSALLPSCSSGSCSEISSAVPYL